MKVRRNVMVDSELWKKAKLFAVKRDMTVSELVENALRKYMNESSLKQDNDDLGV